jgi:hypothetical protein
VAVLTKYDVLVESLKPEDAEDFYGDIEEDVENLDKLVDPDRGLNNRTSASQIDPQVLTLAEEKLREKISPLEALGVPWVKVSGLGILPFFLGARLILKTVNPEFSDTLDELVDVTQQHIDNSLVLLWVITLQQSVVPKIKASIESVPSPSTCDIKRLC